MTRAVKEEWLTIQELCDRLCYSNRHMRRIADDYVKKGIWEFRYRPNTNPIAREYKSIDTRRNKKT